MTGYELENQDLISARAKIFLIATTSRPAIGNQPASYPMDAGILSLGVKQLEHEVHRKSVANAVF